MIHKGKSWLLLITLCNSHYFFTNLTTLQFWDPSPIYAANNYLMPPNSQLVNLRKAHKKDMLPAANPVFSINISGLVQGASRAYDWYGCSTYQSYCGNASGDAGLGNQMGDFRGTIAALPLFLGNDPKGNSIWDPVVQTVDPTKMTKSSFYAPSDTRMLTQEAINKTMLPPCLKDIASVLTGNINPANDQPFSFCPPNGSSEQGANAVLLYSPGSTSSSQTVPTNATSPALFTANELAKDSTYFGAYSLPLEYRKYGMRFEIDIECSEHVGLTIQSGVTNIQQLTPGLIPLTRALAIDAASSTPSIVPNLYQELVVNTSGDTIPDTTIQSLFDEYVGNNAKEIFDSECGLGICTKNFDTFSMEDVRVILSFKNTYDIDRYTKNDPDAQYWPDMLFTPYAWIGGSAPIAKMQDYRQLLSLPFGNNGHASIGGAIGFMFDFADSIEVGFEGGATYFFENSLYRPVPNHPLQRVVYPYWTEVNVKPGSNGHFKFNMNAYQFLNHVSFWATYEVIQHRKDCYSMCNPEQNIITKKISNTLVNGDTCDPVESLSLGTITEQIFYPELLNKNSDWRMQFLNMGLVFDLQPGMQAGFVWQQPISPRNAYYPVSMLATFSLIF